MTPTFTIVIPHKNAFEDLKRCLSTIPDIDDIQVIVVDDSSEDMDESVFYGLSRKNTEFIFNKEEKGAGHARNLALEKAKGEWLIFSDCDDYFVDNMYETAKRSVDNTDADIVFFFLKLDNTSVNKNPLIPETEYYYNNFNDDPAAKEYMYRYKTMQPWNKIIRRSIVTENHIQFQETLVSNDYYFSVATGYYARKVTCVPEYFYVYVIRDNLSVSHLQNEKAILDRTRAYGKVIQFQKDHGVIPDKNLLYSFLYGLLQNNRKIYGIAKKTLRSYISVTFITLQVIHWRIRMAKVQFTLYCPVYNKRVSN